MMSGALLKEVTEPDTISEPEETLSEQVCVPTVSFTTEGILLEFEGMDASPTHPPPTVSVGHGHNFFSLASWRLYLP